jgi:hydrogenase expression/formation protein HypC
MCLAIPSEIVEKNGMIATVDVMGARRQVSLMLLPEEAEVGDFVLVHAGFAIQKIDREAAEESMKLLQEVAQKLAEAPEEY